MISELRDDEILDFLMTSEFEGDYKPDELKYLLTKWRYFYRIIHSRYELLKNESTGKVKNLEDDLEFIKKQLDDLKYQIVKKDELINSMERRKLTLKERIFGKIINKNEN